MVAFVEIAYWCLKMAIKRGQLAFDDLESNCSVVVGQGKLYCSGSSLHGPKYFALVTRPLKIKLHNSHNNFHSGRQLSSATVLAAHLPHICQPHVVPCQSIPGCPCHWGVPPPGQDRPPERPPAGRGYYSVSDGDIVRRAAK